MTYYQKNLYNTFLRVYRTKQNLPYRPRKNFDKFIDTPSYVAVLKLERFFNKFPHIDTQLFFTAPYEVYPDDDAYHIEFYISPKAVRMYSLYMKKRDDESPDSVNQKEYIKRSLVYILKYCTDNNINLDEYINLKLNDLHVFILHLKDHNVSVYTLLGIDGFDQIMKSYDSDRLNFIVGENFVNKLAIFRTRLYNSKDAKKLVIKGTKLIKNIIAKQN